MARAKENAQRNGLANASFHAADLTQDQRGTAWMRQGFDKRSEVQVGFVAEGAPIEVPMTRQIAGTINTISAAVRAAAQASAMLVNGWPVRRSST